MDGNLLNTLRHMPVSDNIESINNLEARKFLTYLNRKIDISLKNLYGLSLQIPAEVYKIETQKISMLKQMVKEMESIIGGQKNV